MWFWPRFHYIIKRAELVAVSKMMKYRVSALFPREKIKQTTSNCLKQLSGSSGNQSEIESKNANFLSRKSLTQMTGKWWPHRPGPSSSLAWSRWTGGLLANDLLVQQRRSNLQCFNPFVNFLKENSESSNFQLETSHSDLNCMLGRAVWSSKHSS